MYTSEVAIKPGSGDYVYLQQYADRPYATQRWATVSRGEDGYRVAYVYQERHEGSYSHPQLGGAMSAGIKWVNAGVRTNG